MSGATGSASEAGQAPESSAGALPGSGAGSPDKLGPAAPAGAGGVGTDAGAGATSRFAISGVPARTNSDMPTLAWDAIQGAASYQLAIAASADCSAPLRLYKDLTTPSQTVAALPDGTYFICVTAMDAAKNVIGAGANNGVSLTIKTTFPGPFVISGPNAQIGTPSPLATWQDSSGAVSYDVTVASDPACALNVAFHSPAVVGNSVVLSGLPDGAYFLCVRASDGFGNFTAASNPSAAFTLKTTPPAAFALTTAPGTVGATPLVSWTASGGASAYTVRVSSSDAQCSSPVQTYTNIAATSQKLATLAAGSYYLCVTASDAFGHATAASNAGLAVTVPANQFEGQPDGATNVTPAMAMNQPAQAFTDGTHLFVSDYANDRVLIWNTIPTANQAPDVVLGQPNLWTTGYHAPSPTAIYWPRGIYSNGTKLFVVDSGNQRILVWNNIPTSNNTPADFALGQPDLSSYTAATSSVNLYYPEGIHSDGTRLFVTETSNNRVLIWNTIPTYMQQPADVVLGQTDMTTSSMNMAPTQTAVYTPEGVFSTGTKLIVADGGHNRVLIWNTMPTVDNTPADVVIGQPDFVTNGFGASATLMQDPRGVTVDGGGRLYVSDAQNNRVLIWNDIPTANNQAANLTLAQSLMSGHGAGPGLREMSFPNMLFIAGTKLYLGDAGNNRVLVWNTLPTVNKAPASFALGSIAGILGAQTVGAPQGLATDGTRFFLADTGNNRVLIWNTAPATTQVPADVVVGQATMSTYAPGTTATTLNAPTSVFSDGTQLYVADQGNNRVLIWSSIPAANGAAASVVLGQATMTANVTASPSPTTFATPSAVAVIGGRLYVSDTGANRVLVWNTVPVGNQTAADGVLGQASFVVNGKAQGANRMNGPSGLYSDGVRLAVADTQNNRVLLWNHLPPVAGNTPADVVLGQPDMSGSAPSTTAKASTLVGPTGVSGDGTRLFVADTGENRVLVWNTTPAANNAPADAVFGQSDFVSKGSQLGATSCLRPSGVVNVGSSLFISDTGYNRVVIAPLP